MLKYHIQLHFIVFLWGFTAILGVLINCTATQIVFYRTAIAAISLFLILKFFQKGNFRIERKEAIKYILIGFLIALHWILFFASAKISKVSICLAGLSTCSLFTAILEPLFKKYAVKPLEIALGIFIVFGLYSIFKFEFDHTLGLLLALASAFFGALFSILNSIYAKKQKALVITSFEMMGAAVFCLLLLPLDALFFKQDNLLSVPSWTDLGYILILSLVCTVYAFYQNVKILKVLSAFYTNLVINLEPVYGILLAFIFFGEKEKMSSGFYIGTSIILFSVILYSFFNYMLSRKKSKVLIR